MPTAEASDRRDGSDTKDRSNRPARGKGQALKKTGVIEMLKRLVLAVVAAASLATTAAPAAAGIIDKLPDLRAKALGILADNDLDSAIALLGKDSTGLRDLDGSGLHTWGFKESGEIIWDHSGQTTPGMNISSMTTPEGGPIIEQIVTSVREDDGHVVWKSSIPHPVTGVVRPTHLFCDQFAEARFLCVMAWE